MADDEEQDALDALEREASDFTKVSFASCCCRCVYSPGGRGQTDKRPYDRTQRLIAFAKHFNWMREFPSGRLR